MWMGEMAMITELAVRNPAVLRVEIALLVAAPTDTLLFVPGLDFYGYGGVAEKFAGDCFDSLEVVVHEAGFGGVGVVDNGLG